MILLSLEKRIVLIIRLILIFNIIIFLQQKFSRQSYEPFSY